MCLHLKEKSVIDHNVKNINKKNETKNRTFYEIGKKYRKSNTLLGIVKVFSINRIFAVFV